MKLHAIPDQAELETIGYDKAEVEYLSTVAKALNPIQEPAKRAVLGRQLLRKLWGDELEYISKTHWISTKDGDRSLLIPNYAQERFYKDVILKCREEGLPIRGVILKARQLGMSTFIQAFQYEQCDRSDLRASMTISFDDPSTMELLNKAKMIHDNMWFPRNTRRASSRAIEFKDNGSTFFAKTAGNMNVARSQTIHHVHCSEIPMWPNASEVLTSINPAVKLAPGTSIIYESTAKGAYGDFYDAWTDAENGESNFIPFFAPWFWDEQYQLAFPDDERKKKFFHHLSNASRHYMARHKLSLEQMRWRAAKIKEFQGNDRRFQQEFPAEPMEAFLTSGSPVFDPDKVIAMQNNATEPTWVGDIILQEA